MFKSTVRNPLTDRPYRQGYDPGHESGAITLELVQRKDPILVATVRSFTRSGRRHTIEVNCTSGHCRCSCEAFTHRAGKSYPKLTGSAGYCKHVSTFWRSLAESVIEINSGKWAR